MDRPVDLLANVERPQEDRPAATLRDGREPAALEGYWLGSAGDEVARWRERALRAEAIVEDLRRGLTRRRWRARA